MYELLLSVIALILSAISVLFVILSTEIKMGLGYRESEDVSRKRKEIETALGAEIRKEFTTFLEKNRAKKTIDDDLMNSIDELSTKRPKATLANEMLESMNNLFNRFIKNILLTIGTIIVTVFYFLGFYELMNALAMNVTFYFFGLFMLVFDIIAGYTAYSNLKWYMQTREAFLKLSEKPTLENAEKIVDDLSEKRVPRLL